MRTSDRLSFKIPLLVEAVAEGRLAVMLLFALTLIVGTVYWLG